VAVGAAAPNLKLPPLLFLLLLLLLCRLDAMLLPLLRLRLSDMLSGLASGLPA
jgi:hypothetical protein